MLPITTFLFPSCPDLLLEEITCEGQTLFLKVRSSKKAVACSLCEKVAVKVHSRYTRTLADLSLMEYAVVLRVQVRRFFCSNPACARKTFAEPFADLAVAQARRTSRQASRLSAIAKELGGRPAARESENVQMPVSVHTLLRLLRRTPLPDAPPPRVLGVDDWSIRKGQTYGTILVDLQRHRIVELLPDREAETLEAWLAAHPGVELISRDRAGAYAQGARKGAPQAQQVTDRFHLLLNLREALKRLFERKHEVLQEDADQQHEFLKSSEDVDTPDGAVPIPAPLTPTAIQQQARRARRLSRYEEVMHLHQQGASQVDIAALVGLNRDTVRRYLNASGFPEMTRPGKRSHLDAYKDYLQQRWVEGECNVKTLHIALTLYPPLLEIVFVRIKVASFAWARHLRKARSIQVATNGVAVESNESSNVDLTCPLLMQVHHFFISTQTPRSPGLLLDSRWRQRCGNWNRSIRSINIF